MTGERWPPPDATLVSPDRLRDFCRNAFVRVQVPELDAAIIADVLVETNLRGVDTHGVRLLAPYIAALTTPAEITPRPTITTVRESPALALLDGGRGMGQVIAVRAMNACIAKAKTSGVAAVGVRNSCHFGMAAYYAMMALPHEMIGFCTTNVEPIMTAFGGVEPVIGNNPEAYAIPAGEEHPIVIDISHSVVAAGKVIQAAVDGRPLATGWVVDEFGSPVTDAETALQDLRLVPAGAAKGYGLSVVMEALAGVLTGAKFGQALRSTGMVDQEVGHFFWALNISALTDPGEFMTRMDVLIREVRASKTAPDVKQVQLPGERGWRERARRTRGGIPLPAAVWRSLEELAVQLELTEAWTRTRLPKAATI